MPHRIATTGWSFPGGATHAIASWGFLWPGGPPVPVRFDSRTPQLAFAPTDHATTAANLTPVVVGLSVAEAQGFVGLAETIEPLDRASRSGFRDGTARHMAHGEHVLLASDDVTVCLTFADLTQRAGLTGLTQTVRYVPQRRS